MNTNRSPIGRWGPAVFVCAVLLAAAVRLLVLVDRHAVDVLFWDQWDLMVPLMEEVGHWELFRFQHGPHRQGAAFVWTAWLAGATDWSTRAEAFGVAAIVIAAASAALLLVWRLRGRLALGDAAIPLLVLTPAQYGIFIHTPNASHGAAPLLGVLLFAHGLLIRDWRMRFAVLLVLDFLLVHTGFGLFVGVLAPLWFGYEIRQALRAVSGAATVPPPAWAAIGACLASLATIGLFFVGYRFDPAVPNFELRLDQLLGHPRYLALMAANLLGLKGTGAVPSLAGGLVLLGALFALGWHLVALARDEPRKESAIVVVLIAFGLLFGETTALGRYALGLPAAQSTRYVPLVVPLLLGLFLATLTLRGERTRAVLGLVAVAVMIFATIPMRASEARFMARLSERKTLWVHAYLETHDIQASDRAARIKIYPWPPERTRLREKLDYLEARGLSFFRDGRVSRELATPRPRRASGSPAD